MSMVGTTVASRYRIDGQVGVGGMGIVYHAYDTTLRREVALKVIAPHAVEQPGARERFVREALAMATMAHPNIVTVYDLIDGDASGNVCIVMELLHGSSLRRKMGDSDRPSFSNVAIQMCRALEYAHSKGILHRDLKPENIFVCDDGTLKLMDFGLARLMDNNTASQHSMVAGTVAYMAPEQLKGEKLDGRTDLYALGVLLYEYICGQPPFIADNPGAVMLKHLTEQPVPLRARIPTLPSEVEAIVLRLLAKDPAGRFPNAAAARAALENPTPSGNATSASVADTIAQIPIPHLPKQSSRPTPTQPAAPAIPMPLMHPPSRQTTPQGWNRASAPYRSRSPLPAILVLLLLFGGGAYGAYLVGNWLYQESEKRKEATTAPQSNKNRANQNKSANKSRATGKSGSGSGAREEPRRSASAPKSAAASKPPRYSSENPEKAQEPSKDAPENHDPATSEETNPPPATNEETKPVENGTPDA